jgi:hypothetical protein
MDVWHVWFIRFEFLRVHRGLVSPLVMLVHEALVANDPNYILSRIHERILWLNFLAKEQ